MYAYVDIYMIIYIYIYIYMYVYKNRLHLKPILLQEGKLE